ncbi:pre-rRNA 2'-O-ribose RNA methyltransferase FTSJ3 [Thrips palmi]|uniref:Putative rRNA methyltransferase n=1 Tax=Thrips palmi TaxID=161013 RepID=A0A6P9A6E1_THRPL|nr:pre-rRNA 2'-O-ribose RNA methyltransferase FTSJ3 [Thrips palmi]
MTIKKKIGKHRKDKFYQLAKETGYRSRAAFKLIQLNRKFSFLQSSRVCVDLCAAPGGWMQVARKNMPVSSIVVGVDLYPIKQIPGCIGIVGDITTEETAKQIEKELQTWKADVVLHDGAPNVGKNWLHDAYTQITLTLSALKLATRFLRSGGWFVTKVFRSKDYHALVWVLKQLFKKVHATKPRASRAESAELFVVCQGYIAPTRLDPRFLDPKYVFEELELEPKSRTVDVVHPEKVKKAPAVGYREGDFLQHSTITAKEFIQHTVAVEALAGLAEIVFEDDEVSQHPATTPEIRECCKDIKVLGRKDIRGLLTWWKTVRADLIGKVDVKKEHDTEGEAEGKEESDDEKISLIDEEELEMEEVDKKIDALTEEEKAEVKRKRKKTNKERAKLQEKMNLKMVLKGDLGPVIEEAEGFNLRTINNVVELNAMSEQAPEVMVESEESDDDTPKPKFERYDKEKTRLDKSGLFYKDSDDSDPEASSEEEDDEKYMQDGLGFNDSDDDGPKKTIKKTDEKKTKKKKAVTFADEGDKGDTEKAAKPGDSGTLNPLITDLDPRPKKDKRTMKANLWFEKDTFKGLMSEGDEDFELDQLAAEYKRKGGRIVGEDAAFKRSRTDSMDNYSDDSDDSMNSDYNVQEAVGNKLSKAEKKAKKSEENGFEVVPQGDKKTKKVKLDEEGLALGALMVSSAKTKRDIVDSGWNKWVFNDDNLPDWFAEDEKKHMKKATPVPQELIDEYKRKMEEINIRPIKKVIEAKARKKRRAVRKLEKAKKKLENIMDNVDMSDKEKSKQIKTLYRKNKEKKKEVTYVIAKKSGAKKQIRRPKGVEGPYKVVDPRMKKDNRKQKTAFKKQGSKGKSTKPVNKAAVRKMQRKQRVQQASKKKA